MMKDARSRETQYGPDVKFVSAAPVKTETMSGYKAIYAFKVINTLRINQNPKSKTGIPADGTDESQKKEEIIRFKLVKGLRCHQACFQSKTSTSSSSASPSVEIRTSIFPVICAAPEDGDSVAVCFYGVSFEHIHI